MYFFFVRILVLDAWLLSQFTGVRKWLQEKGPRILWITLLPLLLLFGEWFYIFLFKEIKKEKHLFLDSTFSHRSTWYLNQSLKHSQTNVIRGTAASKRPPNLSWPSSSFCFRGLHRAGTFLYLCGFSAQCPIWCHWDDLSHL